MSGVVTSQGAVFVTETATRSASVTGAFLSESGGGSIQNLIGGIVPSFTLGGNLSSIFSLVGDVRPAITLSGTLSTSAFSAVDLAGGVAPSVTLGGNLSNTYVLAGSVAPAFTLAGDLIVSGIVPVGSSASALMIGV